MRTHWLQAILFYLLRLLLILSLSLGLRGIPVAAQPPDVSSGTEADAYDLGSQRSVSLSLTPIARLPLQGIARIAAGDSHTCAVTTGGGAKCWGDNWTGQLGDGTTVQRSAPVDVSGLSSGVSAVTAGYGHTCALTTGGGVKCWGFNSWGQLGDGTTTERGLPTDVIGLSSGVTAISAGNSHTCALTTSGGVKCWGDNGNGQLGDGTTTQRNVPVNVSGLSSGVVAVSAGMAHTCALTTGGGVKCWGWNTFGQLGDGTTTQRNVPVDVSGLSSGVMAVAAGGRLTCALTTGGGAKCWGWNRYGQLGDGTTTNHSLPNGVTGLSSGVAAVAPGDTHACALTTSGAVKCWGRNSDGRLGDGTTTQRNVPVDVSGLSSGVTTLAVGGQIFVGHTCALTTGGGVKCWGGNSSGQLGDGTTTQRSLPSNVNGLFSGLGAISAGWLHTCALTTSGGSKCWGYNWYGQLGDGTITDRSLPVDVSGLSTGVTSIAAGWGHTCALTTGGGVKCWGTNGYGQLGDGTTTQRNAPVAVSGLSSGAVAVTAGFFHTCALTTGGSVKCWGSNGYGQLGDGTTTSRSVPVNVSGLSSGVVAVAAGSDHTCALTTGGGVKCWGDNGYGQLGDGTTTQRSTPLNVTGLSSGVVAISAGSNHTCALTSGGGVKCWGWNRDGQLGDGTTTDRSLPTATSGLYSGVAAMSAGGYHSCALTAGDGVKCWGYNWAGQLGDGTTTNRSLPVDVGGLSSGASAVSAGGSHTCALLNSGRAWCWGRDGYGQLGLGTVTQRLTPVDVVAYVPAALTLNYSTCQPGSLFTLTAANFPADSTATLEVNGHEIGTVVVSETGGFVVFLNTAGADAGFYVVVARAEATSAAAAFVLDLSAPHRLQEGGGQTFSIPEGIAVPAVFTYLPLAVRN